MRAEAQDWNAIAPYEKHMAVAGTRIAKGKGKWQQEAASKKSKGSFGRIIDPKEAIQKSIEKRRRLANEWRSQIDLLAEIKNAIELLKKPTLERVAQMLNGRNLTTIRGNSWSKAHVLVQIRAMGFKNLKALAYSPQTG